MTAWKRKSGTNARTRPLRNVPAARCSDGDASSCTTTVPPLNMNCVASDATRSDPSAVVTSALLLCEPAARRPRSRATAVTTAAKEPATSASPYGPGLVTWARASAAQKTTRYTPSAPRRTP